MPDIDIEDPPVQGEASNKTADEMTKAVKEKFASLYKQPAAPETFIAGQSTKNPGEQPSPSQSAQAAEGNKPPAAPVPVTSGQPEASPEADVPLEERSPEGMSKTGKENWDRLRALKNTQINSISKERDTLKTNLEKLTADLEAARKNGNGENHVPVEEMERLKKEKAELEAVVERVALENSPRFQSHYNGKINDEWKFIKRVAGAQADEIVKLLENGRSPESRERWKELKEELGVDGDLIAASYARIRNLSLEREEQLANHKENVKLLKQREAAEAAESNSKTAAKRKAIADSVIASAKSMPEFKAEQGDTAHAQFIGEAESFIRGALEGNLEQADLARLPVQAMQAQYYSKIRIPKMQAEIDSLNKRIQELTGASPSVQGRGISPKAVPNDKSGQTAATYDPQQAVKDVINKFKTNMGR